MIPIRGLQFRKDNKIWTINRVKQNGEISVKCGVYTGVMFNTRSWPLYVKYKKITLI